MLLESVGSMLKSPDVKEVFPFYDVSQLSRNTSLKSETSTQPPHQSSSLRQLKTLSLNSRSLLPKIDELRGLCGNESWLVELALGSLGPFGVLKPSLVCVCPVCVMILVVWNGNLALPASVPGSRAPMKKPVISQVASWGEGVVAFLLLLGYGHCFSQCCVLLHFLCQVYLKGLTEEGVLSSRKLLCCIATPRWVNSLKDVSMSGL